MDIRGVDDAARAAAATRAADALRAGNLVVLPTETVYGVAALATSADALGALRALTGLPADAPLAWHAHDGEQPRALLPLRSGLHRRALDRLAFGPVTFLIDLPADDLTRVRTALGVAPGVIDDGSTLLLRIPGHPFAREAIERADGPVVVAGAAAPGGSGAPTEAPTSLSGDRLALVVNDGPTTMRKPSTLVRLALDGTLRVEREGAVDERRVRKRLTRTVLFVCSGNTCRSPMAAAIANHLIRERGLAVASTEAPIHAESAGTGASRGMPQTPEGVQALRDLGVAPEAHASRPLTRELLDEADAVFVMTPQHRRAALELAPDLADRVHTLDPDGGMIPDPIGMAQSVYNETAQRLRALIERRLDELDDRAHAGSPASPASPGAGAPE